MFIFFGGTNHVGTVCHGLNVPFGHGVASELRASLQTVIVNMSSLTGSMLNSLLEKHRVFPAAQDGAPECRTLRSAFIKGCVSEEILRNILAFPFPRWKYNA